MAVNKATKVRANPKTMFTGLIVLSGLVVGWKAGANKRKRECRVKDSYYLSLVKSDPREISVRILIFIHTCSFEELKTTKGMEC